MAALFQNVLTASFYGSIVIAAVLLLRLVLRKAPRKFIGLLWLLAGLRLLMPFEIQSKLSLQPEPEIVTQIQSERVDLTKLPEALRPDTPVVVIPQEQEMVTDQTVTTPENTVQADPVLTQVADPVKEPVTVALLAMLPWLWVAVALGFGVYTLVSYLRLKLLVRDAVKIPGGWESDKIETAFILGFIKPKIYIPVGMKPSVRRHILAHERTHLEKGDHWFKMVGFMVLAIHWFNPLVWAAYICLCKDIEMACDERVVQFMELEERKSYAAALLSCSANRIHFGACPVAFGEVSVKERVKSVLNYKKPSFWISLLAVAAVLFVSVCLLTNPTEKEASSDTAQFLFVAGSADDSEVFQAKSIVILSSDGDILALTSVPVELETEIPAYAGHTKSNGTIGNAYTLGKNWGGKEKGGMELLRKTLEEQLDISILSSFEIDAAAYQEILRENNAADLAGLLQKAASMDATDREGLLQQLLAQNDGDGAEALIESWTAELPNMTVKMEVSAKDKQVDRDQVDFEAMTEEEVVAMCEDALTKIAEQEALCLEMDVTSTRKFAFTGTETSQALHKVYRNGEDLLYLRTIDDVIQEGSSIYYQGKTGTYVRDMWLQNDQMLSAINGVVAAYSPQQINMISVQISYGANDDIIVDIDGTFGNEGRGTWTFQFDRYGNLLKFGRDYIYLPMGAEEPMEEFEEKGTENTVWITPVDMTAEEIGNIISQYGEQMKTA